MILDSLSGDEAQCVVHAHSSHSPYSNGPTYNMNSSGVTPAECNPRVARIESKAIFLSENRDVSIEEPLTFFLRSHRQPFTIQTVFDGLKRRFNKVIITDALDALVGNGCCVRKCYFGTKVYMVCDGEGKSNVTKNVQRATNVESEIIELDQRLSTLNGALSVTKWNKNVAQVEKNQLYLQMLEEARYKLQRIQQLESEIDSVRVVPPATLLHVDIKLLELEQSKYQHLWLSIRRYCLNIIKKCSDRANQSLDEFCLKLGLQTDDIQQFAANYNFNGNIAGLKI